MKTRRAAALRLDPGITVHNAIRGWEYLIERFLGQGGFGAAYHATRRYPRQNCV